MAIIVENIHNHIFDSEVRKAKKRRQFIYDFYIIFFDSEYLQMEKQLPTRSNYYKE